jgi:hypothetical protein
MNMAAAIQVFNYNNALQNCLTKHLKIFENDIHTSHNPIYIQIFKRKINFIKWILKAIKSNENIPYDELTIMIDTEIIVYKRRLERARTRPLTDKAIDAIQHLEWIRNVIVSTHGKGFNDILFY